MLGVQRLLSQAPHVLLALLVQQGQLAPPARLGQPVPLALQSQLLLLAVGLTCRLPNGSHNSTNSVIARSGRGPQAAMALIMRPDEADQ